MKRNVLLLLLILAPFVKADQTNTAPQVPAIHSEEPNKPMTTYETYSVIIGFAGVIIGAATLAILWRYAWDTYLIRIEAGKQAKSIADQYGEMAAQSKILAQQLAINTKALEHQEKVSKQELEHQLKLLEHELREAEQAADAVFNLEIIATHNGLLTLRLSSMKENVAFIEYRTSNQNVQLSGCTPSSPHRFLIGMPSASGVLYFGIVYKTKRDEVKSQVFCIEMANGNYELQAGYDIKQLPQFTGTS